MVPRTQYATLDGLRIAYQVDGSGPQDLVVSAGSYNHIEVQWDDPAVAVFLRRLAGFSRLIRFDMLGVGGSDRWSSPDPLPAFGTQLDAVLDATGSERTAVLGMLDAGFGAVEYAVSRPERVTHLILYCATARLISDDDYEIGIDEAAASAIEPLLDQGWGTEAMAAVNLPSRADDPRFIEWYMRYMRAIGTPTEVTRRYREFKYADVRDLLGQIEVPTLVLQRRDYAFVPRTHGEYLAEHIAGAEYVELPGGDGPMFWQASDQILRSVERFIRGSDPGEAGTRTVLTLLFTDIADSTRRAAELGDRDWLEVLAHHDEISARRAAQFGGWVVKSTGDGVLAAFPNPSDAVAASFVIRDDLERMDVPIRTGIHAGEVTRAGDAVSGLGVHIASRVMSEARAGEILVSRTVRDLVVGAPFIFTDAGTRTLKGLDDPWQLYEVDRPDARTG